MVKYYGTDDFSVIALCLDEKKNIQGRALH